MGKIIIQDETTRMPVTLMGKEAGVCWGADVNDASKNYKRGITCVRDNHGRVMEYPQIYMVIDGYSAKVIREFYTAIGGMPTRLQSSTRYIDYGDFTYVTPPSANKNKILKDKYDSTMKQISESIKELEASGMTKEDASMLLPLGMTTKVVVRTNLRNLVDMSRQRMCNRAFWEYRQLFDDILNALKSYSEEWTNLIDYEKLFIPKCEALGYCPESRGCGRYPKRGD